MHTKQKPLGIAAQFAAKAERILSRPAHSKESALLARQSKLEEQEAEIQAVVGSLGTQKGAETKSLDSTERRALIAPLVNGDKFPPQFKTPGELSTAIGIIMRFIPEVVEARTRVMTERISEKNNEAAPIRAELVTVRAELEKVQKELSNS